MITVIIPNYNHASFLKQRIDSILEQTFKDFELIILDDYSTDNSKDIIEQYRAHEKVSHIVYNSDNSGSPFIQWEKGIMLAKGEWIWIAESDDWADSRYLEVMTGSVNQNKVGIIYSNSFVTNNGGEIVRPYFNQLSSPFNIDFSLNGKEFIKEYMLSSNSIPNASAVIFRKHLFQAAGRDYRNLKINGDWLFWVELLQQCDIYYKAQQLNYFRTHEKNVRSSTFQNGVFLPEIFYIQNHICNILRFTAAERKSLKYNMLNRLFSEVFNHNVTLSPKRFYECFRRINATSNNTIIPAIKTGITLQLKNWKRKSNVKIIV